MATDEYDLHTELQLAYDEILKLREATTQYGVDGYIRRAQLAEERAGRLEDKNEQLTTEAERLRSRLEAAENTLARQDRDLREALRLKDEADDLGLRLRRDLERTADELQRERQRSADASAAGARAVVDRSFHSAELDKAMAENADLRNELKSYGDDLQAYHDAVDELKAQLELAGDERAALESALLESNGRIVDLSGEVASLRDALADARAHGEELEAAVTTASNHLREAQDSAANDASAAAAALAASQSALEAAQAENRALRDRSAMRALEEELETARRAEASANAAREESAAMLDACSAQLDAALRDCADLSSDRSAHTDAAVRAARAEGAEAASALDATRAQLARAEDHIAAVASQRVALDGELEEQHRRIAAYEAGYGLEDAAREISSLQEAVRRRDADVARVTGAAGMQLDAYDALLEAAGRLAVEAGHPPGVDVLALFPSSELSAAAGGRAERLAAANDELRHQNDALEEQRAKLLRQLRVHAEHTGERALKYYGLSGEHLLAVNEFAEGLREGRLELPQTDRSIDLGNKLRDARAEIESLRAQLYSAAAAGAGAGSSAETTSGVASRLASEQRTYAVLARQQQLAEMLQHVAGLIQQQQSDQQQQQQRTEESDGGSLSSFSRSDVAALLRLARDLASTGDTDAPASTHSTDTSVAVAGSTDKTLIGLQDTLRTVGIESRALRRELREALEEGISGAAAAAPSHGSSTGARGHRNASAALTAAASAADDPRVRDALDTLRHCLDAGEQLTTPGISSAYGSLRFLISALSECVHTSSSLEAESEAAHAAARASTDRAARAEGTLSALQLEHENTVTALLSKDSRSSSSAHPASARAGLSTQSRVESALPAELREALGESEALLSRCLEDIATRDAENTALEASLGAARDALARLTSVQEGVLAAHAAEAHALRSERDDAARAAADGVARVEGLLAKSARLEACLDALESDPAFSTSYLSAALRDATSRLVELEVTQPVLARKCNLLVSELSAARSATRSAEAAEMEVRAHAGARILYLEHWKAGAIAHSGSGLITSPAGDRVRFLLTSPAAGPPVPRCDHENLLAKHAELEARLTELCVSEASARAETVSAWSAAPDLRAVSSHVEHLELQLAEAHAAVEAAREDAAFALQLAADAQVVLPVQPSSSGGGGGGGAQPQGGPAVIQVGGRGIVLASAPRAELLGIAVKQRADIVDLSGRLASLRRQLDLESTRSAELERMLGDATLRLTAAEERTLAQRADLDASHSALIDAEAAVASGLNREDADVLRVRLADAQSAAAEAARDAARSRGIADIAHSQSALATSLVADRETEIAALRASLETLSTRSDEDAIIGGLQAAVLASKLEVSALNRRADALSATLSASRVAAGTLEATLDDARTSAARAESTAASREGALLGQLGDLRAECAALRRAGMDSSAAQSLRSSVASLEARAEGAEAGAAEGRSAAIAAEAAAEEAVLEAHALRAALGDARAAFDAAAGVGTNNNDSVAAIAASFAARTHELHESLRSLQLQVLRMRREIESGKGELALARSTSASREDSLSAAEARIAALEAQAASTAASAAAAGPAAATAAKTTARASASSDTTTAAADAAVVAAAAAASARAVEAATDAIRVRAEDERAKLHAAAAASVDTLRSLLSAKDESLRAAEATLDSTRAELEAARVASALARTTATREAAAVHDSTLTQLRGTIASLEARLAAATGGGDASLQQQWVDAAPPGWGGGDGPLGAMEWQRQVMQRVGELEDAIEERDRRLSDADTHAHTLTRSLERAQADAASTGALSASLQLELEHVRAEAAASRADAESRRAALLRDHELSEAKVRALQAAVVTLKDQFVRAEVARSSASISAAPALAVTAAQDNAASASATASSAADGETTANTASSAVLSRLRDEVVTLRAAHASALAERKKLLEDAKVANAEIALAKLAASAAEAHAAAVRKELLRAKNRLELTRSADGTASPPPPPDWAAQLAATQEKLRKAELLIATLRTTRASPASASLAPDAAAVATLAQLKKRVEALTAQLSEATTAGDAARTTISSMSSSLSRAKADRASVEKRLAALQKRYAALDSAASAVLPELQSSAVLMGRVAELEAMLMSARLSAAAASGTRPPVTAAAAAASGDAGVAPRVTAADDAATISSASNALPPLSRDAPAATASTPSSPSLSEGELGMLRSDNERLRATVKDLTAIAALWDVHRKQHTSPSVGNVSAKGLGQPRAPPSSASGGTTAGADAAAAGGALSLQQQRRTVTALEDMVARLKALTDRQRREIEHLRASADTNAAADAATAVAAAEQKQAASIKRLEDSSTSSRLPAVDLAALRVARADVSRLREKLQALEESTRGSDSQRRLIAELQAEVRALRGRCQAAERTAAAAAQGAADGVASSSLHESSEGNASSEPPPGDVASLHELVGRLRDEIAHLSAENADLRAELEAFDGEFFDEIEELKYKYTEACQKCAAFDAFLAEMPTAAAR